MFTCYTYLTVCLLAEHMSYHFLACPMQCLPDFLSFICTKVDSYTMMSCILRADFKDV